MIKLKAVKRYDPGTNLWWAYLSDHPQVSINAEYEEDLDIELLRTFTSMLNEGKILWVKEKLEMTY
jgi:hypothetical protein